MPTLSSFINGRIVPNDKATLSPFDLGFLRGAGVFEVLRTYQGRPLFLQEHIERLHHSMQSIGIPPFSHFHLPTIVETLLSHHPHEELILRIVATMGVSEDGMHPEGEQALFVMTRPFCPKPKDPIATCTVSISRTLPAIKTLNYLPAVLATQEAMQKGSSEALHTRSDGSILEGASSNFFAVRGDTLITADEGILPGITRMKVLSLYDKVEYRAPNLSELEEYDEAFITSSLRDILPVFSIDEQTIGNGKTGPLTTHLQKLFQCILDETLHEGALHTDRTQ